MPDQIRKLKLFPFRGADGGGSAQTPAVVPPTPAGSPLIEALGLVGTIADSDQKTDNAIKLMETHAKLELEQRELDARNERERLKAEAEASATIVAAYGGQLNTLLKSLATLLKPLAIAVPCVMIAIVGVVHGLHLGVKLPALPLWGKALAYLALGTSVAKGARKLVLRVWKGLDTWKRNRTTRKLPP